MAFLLITSLLGVTLSGGNIFSGLMSLVLTACITKYTYKIIEVMSNGHWEPPSVAEAFTGDGFHLFFKQLAIFIVMGAVIGAAGFLGGWVFLIPTVLFVVLALPASVMVLAREDSLVDAVHPGKLFGVMTAIGWPYLLLFFFILLLYGGSGALLAILGTKISDSVLFPLSLFSGSYFTCVMCALMGYCLYQYQEVLGYTTEEAIEENHLDETSWYYQKALADSSIFFQEGRMIDCRDALKTGLKHRKNDLELTRRQFEINAIGADVERMTKTAEHYLQLLSEKGQLSAAANAYGSVCLRIPNWQPENPEACYVAARGLLSRRRFKEVVVLLKGLHNRSPEYRKLPEAYLMMAQAICDGLRREDQALKVLEFTKKHFAEMTSPQTAKEIDELMAILEKSAPKTVPA
ncbi:DUF4013 domain-containing protein [Parendozoicomonas haliclonae]|uniref:Tetratricopeptide repeat protein n=2 Tax=Parendozoicomonas haliclonae TaxID=1960125 RepID=A0A1X7AL31_9GAMM|nr:hypothetical protein EHSB41UT_01881 [Parendozoicomonas haliclonae]